jgi:CubicO group peptidase (beta-lactamase class C family)
MKTSYLILLVLIFFTSLNAQDKIKKAEELLDKYYETGQLNGAVLIAEKDNILLKKSYGLSEFDALEEMKDNSLFVLASISKSITSLGVLKLIDQGKLSFSDELVDFFPELPYKGVTIKHLLSNTSGLPEYREVFARKWDQTKTANNNDVIALMAEDKPELLFEPGSQFRYGNTSFVFLASIIEKVTGMDYEVYMQEEVFAPLNMKRSLIFTRDKEYAIENFAFPYLRAPGTLLRPVMVRPETIPQLNFLNYLDGVKGDVSTVSCTEDLYRMDMTLLEGNFISSSLLQEAFTPVIPDKASARAEDGYGYGWLSYRNKNGDKIVYVEGGMPGISTANRINMEDNRVIVVLGNTNYTRALNIAENISLLFEEGEPLEPKPPLALAMADYINQKGISGFQEYADQLVNAEKHEINEADINSAGYEFLQNGNLDAAIEYFKLNVKLFPESWNANDSLAEGYMNKGDKELAVKYYKRSIELNPDNENGKNMLKRLGQ